jgi:hypothetical protein
MRQMKSRSRMQRIKHAIRLALIVSASVLVLGTSGPSYSSGSAAPATDTTAVILSEAEADSLLNLIDDQDLEIMLLGISLRESRALARNDSTLAARRLELQQRMYEDMIEMYKKDRDNWAVRLLKHPAIWFMVGAYAGLQVTR